MRKVHRKSNFKLRITKSLRIEFCNCRFKIVKINGSFESNRTKTLLIYQKFKNTTF